MKHDIEMLDKKIRKLNESISEFAKLPPGFGPIIHHAGVDYNCRVGVLQWRNR